MEEPLIRAVQHRPGGVQLLAVLPRSGEISDPDELLRMVEVCRPHAVLPFHHDPDPIDLRSLLKEPPEDVPRAVVDYLAWRGLVLDPDTRQLIRRTLELSAEVSTVSGLARGVYMSRRALGRAFLREGLPVPSHWLHVGRVLRAVLELQWHGETLMRTAARHGYPDGFSLSNQMKRLTGVRPTDVKERIGWEWVLESWIRRELASGGFGEDQAGMLQREYPAVGEGAASA
jgi:AraC-like DNA-binding protein